VSEGNGDRVRLEGSCSTLEVFVGTSGFAKDSPLIVGSSPSGFDGVTMGICTDPSVRPTIDWMRAVDSGAWVSFFPSCGPQSRPAVVIQNNWSEYYAARHSTWFGSDKVWRDWWFRTLFGAIELVDLAAQSDELVIWHPITSSNPWGKQMYGVLLEVLMHMTNHQELAIKRVALGCPHKLTVSVLAKTLQSLRAEGSALREPVAEQVVPEDLGCPSSPGLKLFKVDVPELQGTSSPTEL